MKSSFHKKIIIIFLTVMILSTGVYFAADRYLIQHVEIKNVSAYVESLSPMATTSPLSAQPASATSTAVSQVPPTAVVPKQTITPSSNVASGSWSFESNDLSISIQKVIKGSGNNTLTYFVADVIITDATQLSNAFANNQFGRNIIAYTSTIAKSNNALFAINGDYYGFRTDGIIIRNGVIFRDKPARIGLAFYRDGSMINYDETKTTAQQLLDAGVWNTLSFGPALIKDSVITANLDKVEVDTNFGNHSIQGNEPRTGVGMITYNHIVFIVVDGRSNGYSRGATLVEFAQIFKDLGCTQAYNIDGGGSSTMYFNGKVINNPLGRNQERGTSDILFIGY